MNTFLKSFTKECKHLETNGFTLKDDDQPRRVFAHVLSTAIVKNCIQFNGQYGCDWCKFAGETVAHHGGPPTRYYPYRGPPKMRTATSNWSIALKPWRKEVTLKESKGQP